MPHNHRYGLVAERLELVAWVDKYGTTEESGVHGLVAIVMQLGRVTFYTQP